MGQLRIEGTDTIIFLHLQHTIGRALNSTTVLSTADISSSHAIIRWDGGSWVLFDHSRNGCMVNREFVSKGHSKKLSLGDTIQFGKKDIGEVVNIDPPKSFIKSHTDNQIIELKNIYVLPSEENPQITLYRLDQGRWICETETKTTELYNEDTITCNTESWEFIYNEPAEETIEYTSSNRKENYFEFSITPDEESVVLTFIENGNKIDLEERVHHYILLILARLRLEDHNKKEAPEDQGWIDIDKLLEMLNIDKNNFNIQIFRIRKQLDKVLPHLNLSTSLVERRAQKIRLGYPNFTIKGGCGLKGSMEG